MIILWLSSLFAGLSVNGDSPSELVRVQDVFQYDSKYFILDQGDSKIKVVDATGDLLYEFGEKGQGPGEFSVPSKMGVVKGEIWVYDMAQSQFQRFTLSGESIGVQKLSSGGSFFFEKPLIIKHSTLNSHDFIVYNQEMQEESSFGKSLKSHESTNASKALRFIQVFSTDTDQKHLYSLSITGHFFKVYSLEKKREVFHKDLSLHNYGKVKELSIGNEKIKTDGMPIRGVAFFKDHVFVLVVDENEENQSRMVIFDKKGNMTQNNLLDSFCNRMIPNKPHGSVFLINVQESVIEEQPLVLPTP